MAFLHDYDKILTRLTTILQRLYEGEALSVSDLAQEFNVSTKTIQRDFNQRLCRFPIEKNARKWLMKKGYTITKERSPQEMLVLEMLENIATNISPSFGQKATHLFSKIQNNTQNPLYSKTIIEDISPNIQLFQNVEKAIKDARVIEFVYNNKLRSFQPYKIVSFEGYWYLYGEEAQDEKLKTFYFKELQDLHLTQKYFKKKSYVYEVLENSLNAWFEPNSKSFEVKLYVSQKIAKYFQRRPLTKRQKIEKIYEDSSMEISLVVSSNKEILHEIKKWMPDLLIISPAYLAVLATDNAQTFLSQQAKI